MGNDTNTLICWKRFHTYRKIMDSNTPADPEAIIDAEEEDGNSEVYL
jgi:hypothetical protein